MREVIHTAWENYLMFTGTGMHMALFLASLLLMGGSCRTKNDKLGAFFLSGYSVIFFVLFFCPLTAKIIMDYCVGSLVYWRMFWILPIPLVIAYACSLRLKQVESKWKRILGAAGMCIVIVATGSAVYTLENFSDMENPYKVPQRAVEVCNIISEDAKENKINEKKAVVVNELLPYIRQYDGSIQMPYGRNALRTEKGQSKNSRKIFMLMSDPQINFERLARVSKKEKCNYLVYYKNELSDEALCGAGYERIGENSNYLVYRLGI